MKLSKKALPIIATLTICGAANASSWNWTTIGNDEKDYYFDAESVVRTGNVVILWIKAVQQDLTGSTAIRWRFNCTAKTVHPLGYSDYDSQGKFVKSGPEGREQAVVPDSVADAFLKISCDPAFPKTNKDSDFGKIFDNDVLAAQKRVNAYRKSKIDSAPQ